MEPTPFPLAILALCILNLGPVNSQLLQAINITARLPYPNFWFPIAYDGDDNIYIGSGSGAPTANMMKYSISTKTVSILDPVPRQYGAVSIVANDGCLYTIGGGSQGIPSPVYRFNPDTLASDKVANFSIIFDTFSHFGALYDKNQTIYTFAGGFRTKTLFSFDTKTYEVARLPDLPKWLEWNTAAWVGDKGYIFSRYEHENENPGVLSFDHEAGEAIILPGDNPPFRSKPEAVSDGRYVYLFGAGMYGTEEPADGIYQYDPLNQRSTFLQVKNYPGSAGRPFSGQGAVYVEKLNRIYYFGGVTGITNPIYWDAIGYIDLSPVNGKRSTVE